MIAVKAPPRRAPRFSRAGVERVAVAASLVLVGATVVLAAAGLVLAVGWLLGAS